MSNPLFAQMNGAVAQPYQPQPQAQGASQQQQFSPDMMRREVDSIKGNPVSYLRQRGFNIPDGMTDPKQITQYMLQNGMIGGGRLQQVMRMIGR